MLSHQINIEYNADTISTLLNISDLTIDMGKQGIAKPLGRQYIFLGE